MSNLQVLDMSYEKLFPQGIKGQRLHLSPVALQEAPLFSPHLKEKK
jgi:hypothetical protein